MIRATQFAPTDRIRELKSIAAGDGWEDDFYYLVGALGAGDYRSRQY